MKQSPLTNYYNMPNNMRQPLRTSNDTSPMEELQEQLQLMRSGPSSIGKAKAKEPKVTRVRYVVSVECPTCLENAQHGTKNVTSVAIKTISVHSVGPSSQEPGTENPAAHPEDARAKVNPIIPGLEASWQPRVLTAWSQPPFKTIQMTSMEKTQMTLMEKEETSIEPTPFKTIWEVLISLNNHFLPFLGQNLWPA